MSLRLHHLRQTTWLHRVVEPLGSLLGFGCVRVRAPGSALGGNRAGRRCLLFLLLGVREFQGDCLGKLLQLLLSVVETTQHAEVVLPEEDFHWFGLVD